MDEERRRLQALIDDPNTPIEERVEAVKQLAQLPPPEPPDPAREFEARGEEYRKRQGPWFGLRD